MGPPKSEDSTNRNDVSSFYFFSSTIREVRVVLSVSMCLYRCYPISEHGNSMVRAAGRGWTFWQIRDSTYCTGLFVKVAVKGLYTASAKQSRLWLCKNDDPCGFIGGRLQISVHVTTIWITSRRTDFTRRRYKIQLHGEGGIRRISTRIYLVHRFSIFRIQY